MALQIYVAHSGSVYVTDPRSLDTTNDLKLWIERNVGLAIPCQIIMTSRGTAVKSNALQHEREVFVYDRRLLEQGAVPQPQPVPPSLDLPPPPADLGNKQDLQSWKSLFERRAAWADNILARARTIKKNIESAQNAIKVMEKSVHVANTNLSNSHASSSQTLVKFKDWADQKLKDMNEKLTGWEHSYRLMGRISIHEGVAASIKLNQGPPPKRLQDLFSYQQLRDTARNAELSARQFAVKAEETSGLLENLASQVDNLGKEIQRARYHIDIEFDASVSSASHSHDGSNHDNDEDELAFALSDMEHLAATVRHDYERVLAANKPGASLSQISKWALNSTNEYLPTLFNILQAMQSLYNKVVNQRNSLADITAKFLQRIASIQQQSVPVTDKLAKLDTEYATESNAFKSLYTVARFPALYGAILVEYLRRKEWSDRVLADTHKMAEEFSVVKNDEEKKRKSWQRNTGDLLPFKVFEDGGPMGIDLNLQTGIDKSWPSISRKDVENYIQNLKSLEGTDAFVVEVEKAYSDLDKAVKRHTRRTNAFKMGSVHEAQMAASSIFQSDDAVRSLREDKLRLEDKVKSYESRVRKLEDLLHRNYSQKLGPSGSIPSSIPGTPVVGQPLSPPSASGNPSYGTIDPPSRPGSVASRRISFIDPGEQRLLTSKIAALEAELVSEREKLASEKETVLRLEREVAAKAKLEKELQKRASDAEHMKHDLMANMESQQNEFVTERRELNRKVEEYKVKWEELEEYCDRLEDERLHQDEQANERIAELEAELKTAREQLDNARITAEDSKRQTDERLASKEKQIEELHSQLRKWQEEASRLSERAERTTQALELEKALRDKSEQRLQETQNALKSHLGDQSSTYALLQKIFKALSDDPAPADVGLLSQRIHEVIAQKNDRLEQVSANAKQAEKDLGRADEEVKRVQRRLESRTIRAKDLTQRLYTHNARSIQLLEALGFSVVRRENSMQIIRLSRTSTNASDSTTLSRTASSMHHSQLMLAKADPSPSGDDVSLLYWMDAEDSDSETEKYNKYLSGIGSLDLDSFTEAIIKRLKDTEHAARKYQRDMRAYREKYHRTQTEAAEKIAYKSFKEGDLALFLPTRNQATRPWAAFNVGAPHYFLREQDSFRLKNRDWLLARIVKIEERVVDLSRPPTSASSSTVSVNDNPFDLSDGLRWYYLDATEEKPGAPATPGLGSSTVASAKVDARGSLKSRPAKPVDGGVRKTLTELREGSEQRRVRSGSVNVSVGPTGIIPAPSSSNGLHSARNSVNLRPEDVASITATIGSTANNSTNPSEMNSPLVGSPPQSSHVHSTSANSRLTPLHPVASSSSLGSQAQNNANLVPTPSTPKLGALEKLVGFVRGRGDEGKDA